MTRAEFIAKGLRKLGKLEEEEACFYADMIVCPYTDADECEYQESGDSTCCAYCKLEFLTKKLDGEEFWE